MWAMIACSIAMIIWCAALTWKAHRYMSNVVVSSESQSLEHDKQEAGKEEA
jgi:ACS family pantothenate transporter-like MFS transporter